MFLHSMCNISSCDYHLIMEIKNVILIRNISKFRIDLNPYGLFMKYFILLLMFSPLYLFSQKIKVNEYDKFLKKRRVESIPLTIKTDAKMKMAVSFSAIGSSFYLQLSGAGVGAYVIGEDDKLILLLDNDSTIIIKSTGLQTYDVTKTPSTYKHEYGLTLEDVEKLTKHNLQALRKYHANEFEDVYVPRENYDKVKKLSTNFIEEFEIGRILNTIQSIDVKDIAKYINDSVTFIAKISSAKYLSDGKNAFTELSVGNALPKQLITVIIRGTDRKNFGTDLENFYQGKNVRITGKAAQIKEKIQILIINQDQLIIMGDTSASIVETKSINANVPVVKKETVSKPAIPSRAPGFPGGYNVWIKFLNRNLKRPPESGVSESKTVVVQFSVTAEGDINDIQIRQSAGPTFDAEVLRVLKRMPKWKPAIEKGQPADAVVTQSVTFSRAEELKSF